MTAITGDNKYIIFAESWSEYERGWGRRTDGCTLHLTKEHRDRFVKAFKDRLPEEVPSVYSQPDGKLHPTKVSEELFKEVKESGDGVWGPGRDFEKWEG